MLVLCPGPWYHACTFTEKRRHSFGSVPFPRPHFFRSWALKLWMLNPGEGLSRVSIRVRVNPHPTREWCVS